jgi:hypothetical protein
LEEQKDNIHIKRLIAVVGNEKTCVEILTFAQNKLLE